MPEQTAGRAVRLLHGATVQPAPPPTAVVHAENDNRVALRRRKQSNEDTDRRNDTGRTVTKLSSSSSCAVYEARATATRPRSMAWLLALTITTQCAGNKPDAPCQHKQQIMRSMQQVIFRAYLALPKEKSALAHTQHDDDVVATHRHFGTARGLYAQRL